jgi:hypothetical protein
LPPPIQPISPTIPYRTIPHCTSPRDTIPYGTPFPCRGPRSAALTTPHQHRNRHHTAAWDWTGHGTARHGTALPHHPPLAPAFGRTDRRSQPIARPHRMRAPTGLGPPFPDPLLPLPARRDRHGPCSRPRFANSGPAPAAPGPTASPPISLSIASISTNILALLSPILSECTLPRALASKQHSLCNFLLPDRHNIHRIHIGVNSRALCPTPRFSARRRRRSPTKEIPNDANPLNYSIDLMSLACSHYLPGSWRCKAQSTSP